MAGNGDMLLNKLAGLRGESLAREAQTATELPHLIDAVVTVVSPGEINKRKF